MKAAASASGGTKQAATIRVVLTPLVAAPGLITAAVFAGGGSPVGLLLAVPPTYLLWTWFVDVFAVVGNLFRPARFVERSRYLWFAAASVAPFAAFWAWNHWS